MTITNEGILASIEDAATAGRALDAIPDDWRIFLAGPEEDGSYVCSIQPAGATGVAKRIYERGLVMGRGGSHLVAMRGAVAWLRSRNAVPTA